MLQEVGKFNKIPENLLPKLPESKNGLPVVVKFQFVETFYDPVANQGRPMDVYPNDIAIPMLSKFRDPDTNKWVEIGMVSSVDKDGKPEINEEYRKLFHFNPNKNNGYYPITIGYSPQTDALFQYFMLCSFVEGNKVGVDFKDKTQKIIMKYVDDEALAQKAIDASDLKWKAMGIAANLGEDQMTDMQFILGLSKSLSDVQIKQKVREMAEKDPALFISRVQDESAPFKARIAQALQFEIVSIDHESRSINWNDSSKRELMKVANVSPEGIQNEYAEFVKTPEGQKIDKVLSGDIKNRSRKAKA